MVNILLHWFRFAEATQKKVLWSKWTGAQSLKKSLVLCIFLLGCHKPPEKAALGQGIPLHSPYPLQILSQHSWEAVWLRWGPHGWPSSHVSTAGPTPCALPLLSPLLQEPALWPKQGISFHQYGGLEKHGLISENSREVNDLRCVTADYQKSLSKNKPPLWATLK